MKITGTALSLNVADPAASADFAETHFGFTEAMASDGFVSLEHSSAGMNVIFLPAGQGLLIVFVVEDIDREFARIAAAGATVVTTPETEPWGERYCQFVDPNGIVWQLVQWV